MAESKLLLPNVESPEEGECLPDEYALDKPRDNTINPDNCMQQGKKRSRSYTSNSSEEGECSSSAEEDKRNKTLKTDVSLVSPKQNAWTSKKRKQKAKKRRRRGNEKQHIEQTMSFTIDKNNLNQFYNMESLLTSPNQYMHLISDLVRHNTIKQKCTFSLRDLQCILIQLLRCRASREVIEVTSLSSVVLIWMAHVSAELVKEHWPAFQVTFPSESSNLLHFMNPGTDKFVRPGYDEILLIQDYSSAAKRLRHTPTLGRVVCSYLLKEDEMFVNSFPSSDTHPDCLVLEQVPTHELTDDTVSLLALDCEFCDTASGRALTRISLVNRELECVYDSFVVPEEEITDYKTQYSGITQQKLAGVDTCIEDVYSKLKNIITDKTIIVGHSLENDFQVLKICISHVIDTSFLFTPASTPTFKPSLKFLAKEVLKRDIQTSSCGHDSIEDAKVCMELLLAKLEQGPDYTVSWNEDKRSLVDYMGYCEVNSLLVDHQSQLGKHIKSKNVKCSFATGDDSIVSAAVEGLNARAYEFIWVQMHDFHNFCKKGYQEGKVADSGEVRKLLASMLQLVEVLFNRSSPGTMFIVVAGSGNLQEIKEFNTKRTQNIEQLKLLVDKARQGVAFFKFKSHKDHL